MIQRFNLLRFAVAFAAIGTLVTPAIADGTTIMVTLWDKGANAEMHTDEGMGMMQASMAGSTMGVRLSRKTVKAGEVTFEVAK